MLVKRRAHISTFYIELSWVHGVPIYVDSVRGRRLVEYRFILSLGPYWMQVRTLGSHWALPPGVS